MPGGAVGVAWNVLFIASGNFSEVSFGVWSNNALG